MSICFRNFLVRPLRMCQTPDADEDQPGGADEELAAGPAEDAGRGLLLLLGAGLAAADRELDREHRERDVDRRLDQRVADLPQRLGAGLARRGPAAAPAQHLGGLPGGERDQADARSATAGACRPVSPPGSTWRRTGRPTSRRRRTRPAGAPATRPAGGRRRRRSARPARGSRGRRCCRRRRRHPSAEPGRSLCTHGAPSTARWSAVQRVTGHGSRCLPNAVAR